MITNTAVRTYFKKNALQGNYPGLKTAAVELNVKFNELYDIVQHMVRIGLMVHKSRRYYVIEKGVIVLDQRKIATAATNRKKAEAGIAGALRLKELAFAKGVERNAFIAIGKDDDKIKERIERIGREAEGKGTCYRPTYVYTSGKKRG